MGKLVCPCNVEAIVDTMAEHRIYADETHTGGRDRKLRGLRSVTIGAHCASEDDFEWLERFHRDYFPRTPELKSAIVLTEMGRNERANQSILNGIAEAHIVIVDFAEHTQDLLFAVYKATESEAEAFTSAIAFLKTGRLPEDVAHKVLRFARLRALTYSAVGRVEDLLRQAASASGVPAGRGDKLFDTNALFELSDSEFKELVTRFSVALGESLRPDRQADRIIKTMADYRMAHEGHIAMVCLEAGTESSLVFDQGSSNAFSMLKEADDKIHQAIESWRYRDAEIRSGRLTQEDSRRLRGLQAADIAAGLAAQVFENANADTLIAAKAVQEIFHNVLLNDCWLK